ESREPPGASGEPARTRLHRRRFGAHCRALVGDPRLPAVLADPRPDPLRDPPGPGRGDREGQARRHRPGHVQCRRSAGLLRRRLPADDRRAAPGPRGAGMGGDTDRHRRAPRGGRGRCAAGQEEGDRGGSSYARPDDRVGQGGHRGGQGCTPM
ncbi:MAG: hypothetical protein AVDCRST_MAG24-843, partial [uncultured Nocardioidaceae bacterium]